MKIASRVVVRLVRKGFASSASTVVTHQPFTREMLHIIDYLRLKPGQIGHEVGMVYRLGLRSLTDFYKSFTIWLSIRSQDHKDATPPPPPNRFHHPRLSIQMPKPGHRPG